MVRSLVFWVKPHNILDGILTLSGCIKISPASMKGTECPGTRVEVERPIRGLFQWFRQDDCGLDQSINSGVVRWLDFAYILKEQPMLWFVCFCLFDCFEDRSKREIGNSEVSPNICPEQVETWLYHFLSLAVICSHQADLSRDGLGRKKSCLWATQTFSAITRYLLSSNKTGFLAAAWM